MSLHLVTGAFGFSGSRIAARLVAAGERVRTLTHDPRREHPLACAVDARPYAFDDPAALRHALEGVDVLYNTYWVRFGAAGFDQERAVANTERLFAAARDAGVGRVVHVSITKPDAASPYAYFRGKARLEAALAASGLAHAILRPAVLFGEDDVLVNNIAWLLRRFPVFGVFGDGAYELQPLHVDDFAALALRAGRGETARVVDAVGPERWRYRALVADLAAALGLRRALVPLPAWLGAWAARGLGAALGDVLLTRQEIGALMDGLLATDAPPVGTVRLSRWAREHADRLGARYASELARRSAVPRGPRLAPAANGA
ncbi:MAG: NAD(P)H-binding protein [Planctomycetes bacterium]|nr:NAD(P)H-binding protein [Planctomycetota bacterium]